MAEGFRNWFKKKDKEADEAQAAAGRIQNLETRRKEIQSHIEAGNGVKDDAAQLEQIEETLAGLRARMNKSGEKEAA